MGVEITTQIAGRESRARRELQHLADDLGISYRRLDPDTDDPVLSSYYVVEVPDSASVTRVLDHLRGSPEFSAAYVKGPEAMP
jgi:hypothetical protein